MIKDYQNWINAKWDVSQSDSFMEVINPATAEIVARVPDSKPEEFNRAVEAAEEAFYRGPWVKSTPADRSRILWRWADLLELHADEMARLETEETGKPLELVSRAFDIHDSIDNLRYYATQARDTHGISSGEYREGSTSFFRKEPVGVVGQITPWNYPLQMAVWKAGPALAAGCTIILKPASNTPLTTLRWAELGKKAGLPDGVFNVVTGKGAKGEILATHPDVRMVSLTGSTSTGKRLMELSARTMKRLHLELGGKAPLLVFPDTDPLQVARKAVAATVFNSGQDCTAATRIYVHKDSYKSLVDAVVEEANAVKVGDPLDPETVMGPVISSKQQERIHGFVERARRQGSSILSGGFIPSGLGEGFYYSPTVVTGADQSSEIIQEEIFGPVITINPFSDEDEALRLGNDVVYGLAASVWTHDLERALRVSHGLDFGTVWVNDHLVFASEAPHGGFKQSGFGKELSQEAMKEYQVTKNIMVINED